MNNGGGESELSFGSLAHNRILTKEVKGGERTDIHFSG